MQRRTFLKLVALLPALSTGFTLPATSHAQVIHQPETQRLTTTGYGTGSYSMGSYPTPIAAPPPAMLYVPLARK